MNFGITRLERAALNLNQTLPALEKYTRRRGVAENTCWLGIIAHNIGVFEAD
ncbi:MAG: hypothetical protein RLY97_444 [Pseudomonadota bacterium]